MGLNALFLGYGRMGAALGEAWLGAGLVDGIDAVDPIRAQDVQARLRGIELGSMGNSSV